jgi:hypothetical protein
MILYFMAFYTNFFEYYKKNASFARIFLDAAGGVGPLALLVKQVFGSEF